MRKDYIILNGIDADLTNDTHFTWRLDQSCYPSWNPGDKMTVKMIGCRFAGSVEEGTVGQGVAVRSNLATHNQYMSSKDTTILGIMEGIADEFTDGATTYYLGSGEMMCTMDLLCSRFFSIEISFRTGKDYTPTFGSDRHESVQLILEVSYECTC